ncbi:MAG: hypothetical protein JSR31_07645 [Nitrospira sp.]|nr:hypothetical protein [Nitrospira sp.]
MKGDFSRLTYDQDKQFSRVFMQQGRVQLDADWNEQASIFVESLRSLTADVIGPHGGMTATSFQIDPGETGFHIKKGRYYVQGIGCANATDQPYDKQAHYPSAEPLTEGKYLVYLDVWERHVTATEDDSIREVALGGADTSSRGQIVWQVKTLLLDGNASGEVEWRLKDLERIEKGEALWPRNPQRVQEVRKAFVEYAQQLLEEQLQKKGCVTLCASVGVHGTETTPQYQGGENQLYRVEIHQGAVAASGSATFKWSRENGSVTFPIQSATYSKLNTKELLVTLKYFGSDSRGGLNIDDWVEIVDESDVLKGTPGPLYQIEKVDLGGMETIVTLKSTHPPAQNAASLQLCRAVLRRWDHGDHNGPLAGGAIVVREGMEVELEDNLKITFRSQSNGHPAMYRNGDYWLIPARAATRDIEWPRTSDANGHVVYAERGPRGSDHHYAPLAYVIADKEGSVSVERDCRCVVSPLGQPVGRPLKSPFVLSLDLIAFTICGALLGLSLWVIGTQVPLPTEGAKRLFTYIGIGGFLGLTLSGLYNLFLWCLSPFIGSTKQSEGSTEIQSDANRA